MKKFADTSKIKILDLGKANSYTQRGRYVVTINGEQKLSGDTEAEALLKTLAMVADYHDEYKMKYFELVKLCGPLVKHLSPDDDSYED